MEELSTMSIEGVDVTSYAVEQASVSNNEVNRKIDDCFMVTLCYKDNLNPEETSLVFKLEKYNDYRDQLVVAFAINAFETLNIDAHADYCIIDVVAESCDVLLQQVSELGRKSLAMVVKVEVNQDYVVDDNGIIGSSTFALKNYLSSYGGVKFISCDQIGSRMECCSICLEELEKQKDNSGDDKEDDVAVLPCCHVFHGDCLVSWIAKDKNICPLCRYNLVLN
ncbi:E3 ubiquitin-protein ligase RING1-like [Bienertia sinuspersici]